jgi:dTDP-4-dehydrorhamnose reductase
VNGPQKALVLGGKSGLLGRTLAETLEHAGWIVHAPGREELDVFDQDALSCLLHRKEIGYLFNTVAYTQVDRAEEQQEEAYRLNRALPALLGRSALGCGVTLVHFSTDFVFDGTKDMPYIESDEPNPRSVYGKSKLAGERALLEMNLTRLLIIRTAWLFGPYRINFVDRIIELARERDTLNVVHDQIGAPTLTSDLAQHTRELVISGAEGIYHLVNSGKASWCELAAETVTCMGLACRVQAIPSREYPQKAERPAYSVLDTTAFTRTTGQTPRPWIKALRSYLFQKGDHQPEV